MVIRTFLIDIFINSVRWTEDHCIYRAKIESIQEGKSRKINEYGVRFIDFGMYFCNRVIQSVMLCIVARVHGIGHLFKKTDICFQSQENFVKIQFFMYWIF